MLNGCAPSWYKNVMRIITVHSSYYKIDRNSTFTKFKCLPTKIFTRDHVRWRSLEAPFLSHLLVPVWQIRKNELQLRIIKIKVWLQIRHFNYSTIELDLPIYIVERMTSRIVILYGSNYFVSFCNYRRHLLSKGPFMIHVDTRGSRGCLAFIYFLCL